MTYQELESEIAEYNALLDLQHRRMVEASRLWQRAHGYEQDSIWPDLGELLAWLTAEMAQAKVSSAAWKRAAKFYRVYYHTPKLYKFTRWNVRGDPESRLKE